LVLEGLDNLPTRASQGLVQELLDRCALVRESEGLKAEDLPSVLEELESTINQMFDQGWDPVKEALQPRTVDFGALLVQGLSRHFDLYPTLRSSQKLNDFSCFLPEVNVEIFPFRIILYRLSNPQGFSLISFWEEMAAMLPDQS
jgi:hypothetical protein